MKSKNPAKSKFLSENREKYINRLEIQQFTTINPQNT